MFFLTWIKDEYEGLKSSRQEMVHKLNECTAHCEEVERQRDEEAGNCRLLQVHTLTVHPFSYSYLGLCWLSLTSPYAE